MVISLNTFPKSVKSVKVLEHQKQIENRKETFKEQIIDNTIKEIKNNLTNAANTSSNSSG